MLPVARHNDRQTAFFNHFVPFHPRFSPWCGRVWCEPFESITKYAAPSTNRWMENNITHRVFWVEAPVETLSAQVLACACVCVCKVVVFACVKWNFSTPLSRWLIVGRSCTPQARELITLSHNTHALSHASSHIPVPGEVQDTLILSNDPWCFILFPLAPAARSEARRFAQHSMLHFRLFPLELGIPFLFFLAPRAMDGWRKTPLHAQPRPQPQDRSTCKSRGWRCWSGRDIDVRIPSLPYDLGTAEIGGA